MEGEMSELDELRRRVDRLEARAEIAELVTSYAVACDEHDMPRLMSLFTADASFGSPSGVMVADSPKQIEDMFIKLFKVRGAGYHWTHDHVVKFDAADSNAATGLVLSHAETTPQRRMSLAAMRYDDEYRRVGGKWLFRRRTINFLYYAPATEFDHILESADRLTVNGERRKADYPENLPAWREFERRHGGS
jgi:ketosteroid isomerase-like protein